MAESERLLPTEACCLVRTPLPNDPDDLPVRISIVESEGLIFGPVEKVFTFEVHPDLKNITTFKRVASDSFIGPLCIYKQNWKWKLRKLDDCDLKLAGVHMDDAELQDGDTIQIGVYKFTFKINFNKLEAEHHYPNPGLDPARWDIFTSVDPASFTASYIQPGEPWTDVDCKITGELNSDGQMTISKPTGKLLHKVMFRNNSEKTVVIDVTSPGQRSIKGWNVAPHASVNLVEDYTLRWEGDSFFLQLLPRTGNYENRITFTIKNAPAFTPTTFFSQSAAEEVQQLADANMNNLCSQMANTEASDGALDKIQISFFARCKKVHFKPKNRSKTSWGPPIGKK
jgi:hypothetical protein